MKYNQEPAPKAKQFLDSKRLSSKVERQSAESENHGDVETAGDPNAMGPSMRQPYEAVSPKFEGSEGFDQMYCDTHSLNGPALPKKTYYNVENDGPDAYKGVWPEWIGRRRSDKE